MKHHVKHYTRQAHKHRSSLLLIVLLLVLLGLWWKISFIQIRSQSQSLTAATTEAQPVTLLPDVSYTPPAKVVIHSRSIRGGESYSGSLVLPNCDTFSTSFSTQGHNGAAISLTFMVSKTDAVCDDVGTSSAPFAISYSSGEAKSPPLTNLVINNRPALFSLVEVNSKTK